MGHLTTESIEEKAVSVVKIRNSEARIQNPVEMRDSCKSGV
jgi:hypothetical protein